MKTLAVDIGNSSWKAGLFDGARLLRTGTAALRSRPDRVLVSSVNPPALRKLLPRLRRLGAPVRIAGKDIPIPLKNPCRGVGPDRLLGAYAAWRRVRGPVLVIDIGTAMTLNLVDVQGRFVGGAIFAGPETALRALADGTALLPRVRPTKAVFPARATREALQAGARLACLGFAREGIAEAAKALGKRPVVFVTGGGAGMLAGLQGARFVPGLVLEGLAEL